MEPDGILFFNLNILIIFSYDENILIVNHESGWCPAIHSVVFR